MKTMKSAADKFAEVTKLEAVEKPMEKELEAKGQIVLDTEIEVAEKKIKNTSSPKNKTRVNKQIKDKAEPIKEAATEPIIKLGRPKEYKGDMQRVNFKIPASLYDDMQLLSNVKGTSLTKLIIEVFTVECEKESGKINTLKSLRS